MAAPNGTSAAKRRHDGPALSTATNKLPLYAHRKGAQSTSSLPVAVTALNAAADSTSGPLRASTSSRSLSGRSAGASTGSRRHSPARPRPRAPLLAPCPSPSPPLTPNQLPSPVLSPSNSHHHRLALLASGPASGIVPNDDRTVLPLLTTAACSTKPLAPTTTSSILVAGALSTPMESVSLLGQSQIDGAFGEERSAGPKRRSLAGAMLEEQLNVASARSTNRSRSTSANGSINDEPVGKDRSRSSSRRPTLSGDYFQVMQRQGELPSPLPSPLSLSPESSPSGKTQALRIHSSPPRLPAASTTTIEEESDHSCDVDPYRVGNRPSSPPRGFLARASTSPSVVTSSSSGANTRSTSRRASLSNGSMGVSSAALSASLTSYFVPESDYFGLAHLPTTASPAGEGSRSRSQSRSGSALASPTLSASQSRTSAFASRRQGMIGSSARLNTGAKGSQSPRLEYLLPSPTLSQSSTMSNGFADRSRSRTNSSEGELAAMREYEQRLERERHGEEDEDELEKLEQQHRDSSGGKDEGHQDHEGKPSRPAFHTYTSFEAAFRLPPPPSPPPSPPAPETGRSWWIGTRKA